MDIFPPLSSCSRGGKGKEVLIQIQKADPDIVYFFPPRRNFEPYFAIFSPTRKKTLKVMHKPLRTRLKGWDLELDGISCISVFSGQEEICTVLEGMVM